MNAKLNITFSSQTLLRASAAKQYIQQRYNLLSQTQQQRRQEWQRFEQKIKQFSILPCQAKHLKSKIQHLQMQQFRRRRTKISKKHFQAIKVIGRGAFGEVYLCREITNGRIVAIKCLKKTEMVRRQQQGHLRAQRDLLAEGGQQIVRLHYSFQDHTCLYLVMEFMQGGDLMNLLIERNVLPQQEAKFYIAEIVLAVECIHQKNYIHRDLKPDNVLIGRNGHVKLSDFGLCKHNYECVSERGNIVQNRITYVNDRSRRKLAFSAVGTPDYVAPEMLSRQGYTFLVDWWALGIMLYQMLIGYAPFTAPTNQQIYHRIEHNAEYLNFPPKVPLSYEVIDFISKLLLPEKLRLGANGVQQIKSHPWFHGIDFSRIRSKTPPFVPNVTHQTDTKYFEEYQQEQPWLYQPKQDKKDFNFVGYTYKEDQNNNIIKQEINKIYRNKQQVKPVYNLKKKHFNNTLQLKTLSTQYGQKSPYRPSSKNNTQRLPLRSISKSPIKTTRKKPAITVVLSKNKSVNKIAQRV